MKNIITIAVLGIFSLATVLEVEAGTLAPTSAPGESMYSLQEIYNLIVDSTESEVGNGDSFTVPAVGSSMVTLKEIYEALLSLKESEEDDTDEDDDTDTDTDEDDDTDTDDDTEEEQEYDTNTYHPNINNITFVSSSISVVSATERRFGMTFKIDAIGQDLYFPQTQNKDFLVVGNMLATDAVPTVTPTFTARNPQVLANAEGYFIVPAGTTQTFHMQVYVDNTGGQLSKIAMAMNAIEYKVPSVNPKMRKFPVSPNIFKTDEAVFAVTPTI